MKRSSKIVAALTLAATLAVWPCAARAAETTASTESLLGGAAQEQAPEPAQGAPDGAARESTPGTAAAKPAPMFHIQLWDAQKTNWEDAALAEAAAAGFTVMQNGWSGSLFPSERRLEEVRKHGLYYGAYINTRLLFQREATPREKESVHYAVGADGKVSKSELNAFDGVYHAVVARGMRNALRQLAKAESLYKIMLNSERNAPISYDDLTIAEAIEAGVMREGLKLPLYSRGVAKWPLLADRAEFADPYEFIMWFDRDGGERPVNRAAADAARAERPGVLATADPLNDGLTYGQFHGMDIFQSWARVHQAPRDPLAIASGCERLKAHVRHEGRGEIWIGPQLGTKSGNARYAAPADEFEEALWLAAAFGARGITMWGYDTLRRDSALDMDTWGRVRRFRDKLTGEYAHLIGAPDAPRACAVLLSKANQVLSGRVYYEIPESYENFHRVLLTAHVPTDVLYDDDVLEGRLAKYKALFLPGIERLTPELDSAIAAFEKSGGRVVRWPFLRPRYADYEITKGNTDDRMDVAKPGNAWMLPHQYRKWRQMEAAKVFEKVADLMDVRVDNPDVIMNVVEAGGKRYVILVNDKRTYGEWTKERGHRWCEDEGGASEATVSVKSATGSSEIKVTLAPAGIVAVPVDAPGPK